MWRTRRKHTSTAIRFMWMKYNCYTMTDVVDVDELRQRCEIHNNYCHNFIRAKHHEANRNVRFRLLFSSSSIIFSFLLSFVLILVSVFFRLPQKVSLRARAIVYSFFRFSVRSSAVQFHCYPLVNFRRMTFIHRTIVLRRFSPFQIHNTQRCMGSNGWQHNRNERSAQHLRSIFSLK